MIRVERRRDKKLITVRAAHTILSTINVHGSETMFDRVVSAVVSVSNLGMVLNVVRIS